MMNRIRFHPVIRTISIILIGTFLCQDIAWANPDFSQGQRTTLAPQAFTQNPSPETIDRVYIQLVMQEVEKFRMRLGIPLEQMQLDAVDTILKKLKRDYKGEPGFDYNYRKEAREILINFGFGTILRYYYYDPAELHEDKYANQDLLKLPLPATGGLHVQLLKVNSLPNPAAKAEAAMAGALGMVSGAQSAIEHETPRGAAPIEQLGEWSGPEIFNQIVAFFEWIFTNLRINGEKLVRGKKVLDVGTGLGFIAVWAKRNGAQEVIGIDPHSKSIETARVVAAREGLDIKYENGNATALRFNENEFDAVTVGRCLEFISTSDRRHALREIFRVLKPGGSALIVSYHDAPYTQVGPNHLYQRGDRYKLSWPDGEYWPDEEWQVELKKEGFTNVSSNWVWEWLGELEYESNVTFIYAQKPATKTEEVASGAPVGMAGLWGDTAVSWLRKVRIGAHHLSDRNIAGIVGAMEELLFSGLLVSGTGWLFAPVVNADWSMIGIAIGTLASIVIFPWMHEGKLYYLNKDGRLESRQEGLSIEEDFRLNILRIVLTGSYLCSLIFCNLNPTIPLLLAGLMHASYNMTIAPRMGSALGMIAPDSGHFARHGNAESKTDRAKQLISAKRHQEALDLLLTADQSDAYVLSMLTSVYKLLKRYEEAIQCGAKVPPRVKNYHLTLINIAEAYLGLNKCEEAHRHLDRAERAMPEYGQGRLWLLFVRAHVLRRQGRQKEEMAIYDRILAIDGSNSHAMRAKAHLLWSMGQRRNAIKLMGALTSRGGSAVDRDVLYSWKKTSEPAELLYYIEPAVKAELMQMNKLADGLIDEGKYAKAEAMLKETEASCPHYKDTLMNLARVMEATGRYEEAIAYEDRRLAIKPGNAHSIARKARSLFMLGRYEEAVQLSGSGNSIVLNETVTFINKKACAIMRQGNLAEAEHMLLVALELDAGDIYTLTNLAEAYLHMGRTEDAYSHIDMALAINPKDKIALFVKAQIFKKERRYREELGMYDEILKIDPADIFAMRDRAHALWALGRHAEAAEAIAKVAALTNDSRDIDVLTEWKAHNVPRPAPPQTEWMITKFGIQVMRGVTVFVGFVLLVWGAMLTGCNYLDGTGYLGMRGGNAAMVLFSIFMTMFLTSLMQATPDERSHGLLFKPFDKAESLSEVDPTGKVAMPCCVIGGRIYADKNAIRHIHYVDQFYYYLHESVHLLLHISDASRNKQFAGFVRILGESLAYAAIPLFNFCMAYVPFYLVSTITGSTGFFSVTASIGVSALSIRLLYLLIFANSVNANNILEKKLNRIFPEIVQAIKDSIIQQDFTMARDRIEVLFTAFSKMLINRIESSEFCFKQVDKKIFGELKELRGKPHDFAQYIRKVHELMVSIFLNRGAIYQSTLDLTNKLFTLCLLYKLIEELEGKPLTSKEVLRSIFDRVIKPYRYKGIVPILGNPGEKPSFWDFSDFKHRIREAMSFKSRTWSIFALLLLIVLAPAIHIIGYIWTNYRWVSMSRNLASDWAICYDIVSAYIVSSGMIERSVLDEISKIHVEDYETDTETELGRPFSALLVCLSLARYGFTMPVIINEDQLSSTAVGMLIYGHISEDTFTLLEEAGRHKDCLLMIALNKNWIEFGKVNGRKLPLVRQAFVFHNGRISFVRFSKPRPAYYIVDFSNGINKHIRKLGLPNPGHMKVEDYCDEKDITALILSGAGIRIPKTISFIARNKVLAKRRKKAESVHIFKKIDEQATASIRAAVDSLFGPDEHKDGISSGVVKPNHGQCGNGVSFFGRDEKDRMIAHIAESIKKGENLIAQEQIIPPLIDGCDWNLRVFISKDKIGNPVLSGIVVRIDKFGGPVNISKSASVLTFEELVAKLGLSAEQALAMRKDTEAIAICAYRAVRDAMIADGVLKKGEDDFDFMSADIIFRMENGRLVPYILEVNDYHSGSTWDIDNHLRELRQGGVSIDEQSIGQSSRDWVNTMTRRAAEFRDTAPSTSQVDSAQSSKLQSAWWVGAAAFALVLAVLYFADAWHLGVGVGLGLTCALPGMVMAKGGAGGSRGMGMPGAISFKKFYELFYRKIGIFNNTLQSPAVNLAVIGDNQRDLRNGIKEFDVASALTGLGVSALDKSPDYLVAGEQRRFHIARAKILWEWLGLTSLGLGSKYNRIASLIFLTVSFSVLPWLWHPGSEGTLATIYPSLPFSNTILSFIFLTSAMMYTSSGVESQGKTAPGPAMPPGSIYGVFKYLCDHNVITADSAVSGEILAKSAALSFESIKDDLRGLLLHLHLIEKAPGGESGKDSRYYVPEAVKKKAAEIMPILEQFRGDALRPTTALLDQVYEEKIKPLLESPAAPSISQGDNSQTAALPGVAMVKSNPSLSATTPIINETLLRNKVARCININPKDITIVHDIAKEDGDRGSISVLSVRNGRVISFIGYRISLAREIEISLYMTAIDGYKKKGIMTLLFGYLTLFYKTDDIVIKLDTTDFVAGLQKRGYVKSARSIMGIWNMVKADQAKFLLLFTKTETVPVKTTSDHIMPPGSIYGIFKYLCDHDVITANSAISGDVLAKSAGEEHEVRQKALSFESIKDDLRGLFLHLHLIEKTLGGETGKDARYYVPEAVKKKSAEILPILEQFRGDALRPNTALLDKVYNEKIKPLLEPPATPSTSQVGASKITEAILSLGNPDNSDEVNHALGLGISSELPKIPDLKLDQEQTGILISVLGNTESSEDTKNSMRYILEEFLYRDLSYIEILIRAVEDPRQISDGMNWPAMVIGGILSRNPNFIGSLIAVFEKPENLSKINYYLVLVVHDFLLRNKDFKFNHDQTDLLIRVKEKYPERHPARYRLEQIIKEFQSREIQAAETSVDLRAIVKTVEGGSEPLKNTPPSTSQVDTVKTMHELFGQVKVADGARVILSENLFGEGLEEVKIALGSLLNDENSGLAILPVAEIRRRAINAKTEKDKLAIVMTEENFNNDAIWNVTDKETALKASVLLLKDKLSGENYLYLEGVIGLARAIMANDKNSIQAHYRMLSGVAIADDVLKLLDDGRINTVVFALRAILRLKPIDKITDAEFASLRLSIETALIAA